MLRSVRRVLVLACLLGCSDIVNPNCSDRGCVEGLSVRLRGDLPATFTLRMITLSTAPWEVPCTSAGCERIEFEGFLPRNVSIEIEADGEVIFGENYYPTYDVIYPNGPRCGGSCLYGTLEIEI